MTRFLQRTPLWTAVGFSLGVVEHLTFFVLASTGRIPSPPYYPPWRHLIMAAVDGFIATVAVRRPRALVFVLAVFVAEQLATNGRGVLLDWMQSGVVHEVRLGIVLLEVGALLAAAFYRWRSAD
jgi:hypothetical protein